MADNQLEKVVEAARKLVKAKGRYHTEQNYKALADALSSYDAARRTPVADGAAVDLPELNELPRPAVTYADHSYPAFSKKQMADYAEQYAREAISHYLRKQAGQVGVIEAARAVVRSAIDGRSSEVHPCDRENDDLAVRACSSEIQALHAALKVGQEDKQPTINKGKSNG